MANNSIDALHQIMIAEDALGALDALESIITVAREQSLHPAYLKEKIDKVQRCLCFMKEFIREV